MSNPLNPYESIDSRMEAKKSEIQSANAAMDRSIKEFLGQCFSPLNGNQSPNNIYMFNNFIQIVVPQTYSQCPIQPPYPPPMRPANGIPVPPTYPPPYPPPYPPTPYLRSEDVRPEPQELPPLTDFRMETPMTNPLTDYSDEDAGESDLPSPLQTPYNQSDDETVDDPMMEKIQRYDPQEQVMQEPPARMRIGIQPEVIETHDFIVIRLKIPEGMSEDHFKISIETNHAKIRWEQGYLQQVVQLPPDIIREEAAAVVKNNILEIRIPRRQDFEYRKISIHT